MGSGHQTPGRKTVELMELQESLPQLPVPRLEDTIETYLRTVQPIVTSEQYEATKKIAKAFLLGEGSILQAKLVERARLIDSGLFVSEEGKYSGDYADDGSLAHPEGKHSRFPHTHWLESWWEMAAYMSDNTSVAVNINCFTSRFHASAFPENPLLRCSWLIFSEMRLKEKLEAGLFPPDYTGKTALCSAQYSRAFSTTRIPGNKVDTLHTWVESRHICVQRRGYWYAIEDASTASQPVLLEQLEWIKRDADSRDTDGPGIGVLTALNRRDWANERSYISAGNGNQNPSSLRIMETAIFHVILSKAKPETKDELQRIGQCGSRDADIWFDKCHTHIVCDNGMVATNLEHSTADAVCPCKIIVAIDEWIQINAPQVGCHDGTFKVGLTGWDSFGTETSQLHTSFNFPKLLDFSIDQRLQVSINRARNHLDSLIEDNIVTCFFFSDFGFDSIYKNCKGVSPDSFMQISLALAYFRDQGGEIPTTYETASTRKFLHGRTECIRPQSSHLTQLLRLFDDPNSDKSHLASLATSAATFHRNYSRACSVGQGVDRHLLGLRLLARELNLPEPIFFQDYGYKKSSDFLLSTSQMPWAVNDCPGFGAYSPKAYAVCYRFTRSNGVCATVCSRRISNNRRQDAVRFREAIRVAMKSLYDLLAVRSKPLSNL